MSAIRVPSAPVGFEPLSTDTAAPMVTASTATPATPAYACLRRRALRPALRCDEAGAVGR